MATRKVKSSADLKVITEEHPSFVGKIARYLIKFQDVLGYTLVGILIIVAVIVLLNYNKKAKNAEASASLQSAFKQYQQDLAASTISFQSESEEGKSETEVKTEIKSPGAFQAVFDNYAGTDSGDNALLMVGFSNLNTGANAQALEAFDKFLSINPDHPLAASALLGKATVLFNTDQVNESLTLLKEIGIKYPEFKLLDVVGYETALRYEALGQWEDARKSYQAVIDGYPDSTWKQTCEIALKKLDKKQAAGSSAG